MTKHCVLINYWSQKSACVFFRELGYQHLSLLPLQFLLRRCCSLIKKLIQSWKERSHAGFGRQCWAHVPAVALPASGTSLFISIHWKIQCQPELQLGALCWVWAAGLQEEEGKSCSDWACSVIQPSCPSGFLRLGSVWWYWGEGWMAQTRAPHKGRDIMSEETQ